MNRKHIFSVSTALLFSLSATILSAQTWDGGGDGTSWEDPLNWDGNAIPTSSVTINSASVVNIDSSVSNINGLYIQDNAILNINSGGVLTAGTGGGAVAPSSGAVINVDGGTLNVYTNYIADFGGGNGGGSMNIINGGIVNHEGFQFLVGDGYSPGFLKISGTGSALNLQSNMFSGNGSMQITLSDGGVIDMTNVAAGNRVIGLFNGGSRDPNNACVLNIGEGGAAGNFVNVEEITASNFNGVQDGIVNFNHNESNYLFSIAMTDSNAANQRINVNHVGSGKTVFTTDQAYTGTTTVSNGILQLGNGGTTGSVVSSVVLSGGTLAINRSDNVILGTGIIGGISGTGTIRQSGTGVLAVTDTVAGSINAGFEISSGTLKYTASSSATISNGTRILSGATNAVLDVSDVNVVNMSSLVMNGDGTLLLDTRHGNNDLFLIGTLTVDAGQNLTLALESLNLQEGDLYTYGASYAYDLLAVSNLILSGNIDATGLNGSFTDASSNIWNYQGVEWDGISKKLIAVYSMTMIPEPSAYGFMLGVASLVLLGSRRRRK